MCGMAQPWIPRQGAYTVMPKGTCHSHVAPLASHYKDCPCVTNTSGPISSHIPPPTYTGIALTYTDVTPKLHRLPLKYLHTSPPTLHRYPLKLHRLPPIHTSPLNSKDIASNLHITLTYTCAAITSLHTYTSWSCGSSKQRAGMAWGLNELTQTPSRGTVECRKRLSCFVEGNA